MKYDAIILAGGESSSELKSLAPHDNEALINIGRHPMIYYVYEALIQSERINHIVISGPPAVKELFPPSPRLFFSRGGQNAIDSFTNAAHVLEHKNITPQVLIVPSDIPFIHREAIDDFITRCEQVEGDFYYSIVSREVIEKKFPGVERTYVGIKEGIFTGGNLFMIRSNKVEACREMGIKLINRRKNPLAIARLFGLNLFARYVLKQLSIKHAEKRFYQVMGLKGRAIVSPFAEVGVDVDKPSDLELARKILT